MIKGNVKINRKVLDIEDLNTVAEYKEPKYHIKPLKCPDKRKIRDFVEILFPPSDWLLNYNVKKLLLNDVIAGVTQFVLNVPQGLAYGIMAGYEAINGIYTSFFPPLVYLVFGSSRHNSMGTFAIIALLTTSVIHNTEILCDEEKGTCADGEYTAIQIGTALTFYVGIIQLIMWLLRLGILSTVLSSPFISAFTTAAALHTFTANFTECFGIKSHRTGGLFKLILTYYDLFCAIHMTNIPTFILSITCLFILIVNNELFQPWLSKKTKLPFPVELIILLVGDFVSWIADFPKRYRIKIVGFIPSGLPKPTPPDLSLFNHVITGTVSIVIVSYAITVSLGISFSKKCNTVVDNNQELLAMGLSNIVGSFFECFPVCASLARGALTVKLGGMTQLTSFVSCIFLLLLILWIGPLFQFLPRAILSTVIMASLRNVLFQVKDLPRYWKLSKVDFSIWMVTFLTGVILQIDLGLYIGIGYSLVIIMITTFTPRLILVGSLPNTEFYLEQKRYQVDDIDKIYILSYKGELTFPMKMLLMNKLRSELKFDVREYLIKKARERKKVKESGDDLRFYVLILDLSGVAHLDVTGCECLTELYTDYKQIGVEVIITGLTGGNYTMIRRYRDVLKTKNNPLLFPSTMDAVVFAKDNLIPIAIRAKTESA